MFKLYLNALVKATAQRLQLIDINVTDEEVAEVLDKKVETSGNWDKDLETLYQTCLRFAEDISEDNVNDVSAEASPEAPQGEEKDPTQTIDDIVASLKVGYNIIPGIGPAYCSNEEDLKEMRTFLRGTLTALAMQGSLPPTVVPAE